MYWEHSVGWVSFNISDSCSRQLDWLYGGVVPNKMKRSGSRHPNNNNDSTMIDESFSPSLSLSRCILITVMMFCSSIFPHRLFFSSPTVVPWAAVSDNLTSTLHPTYMSQAKRNNSSRLFFSYWSATPYVPLQFAPTAYSSFVSQQNIFKTFTQMESVLLHIALGSFGTLSATLCTVRGCYAVALGRGERGGGGMRSSKQRHVSLLQSQSSLSKSKLPSP